MATAAALILFARVGEAAFPDGRGGGQLVGGSVAPVCAEELFCLIDRLGAARCLTPAGTWPRVHSKLAQIVVTGTQLVGLSVKGVPYYYDTADGGLPFEDEKWRRLNDAHAYCHIAASDANLWALDLDGFVFYRETTWSPDEPWKSAPSSSPLNQISSSGDDLFGVDRAGDAWRLRGGYKTGQWTKISGNRAGKLTYISAMGDHAFGVYVDEQGQSSAWYRDCRDSGSASASSNWVKVADSLGKNRSSIDGMIAASKCGGLVMAPDGDSFYTFTTSKEGALFYRFVYCIHPAAGDWALLPQAEKLRFKPLGEPASHDLLEERTVSLAKNTTVATVQTHPYFRLSFDLNLQAIVQGAWSSIVHFSIGPDSVRVPAVWLKPSTSVLVASLDSTAEKNVVCDTQTPLEFERYQKVTVENSQRSQLPEAAESVWLVTKAEQVGTVARPIRSCLQVCLLLQR